MTIHSRHAITLMGLQTYIKWMTPTQKIIHVNEIVRKRLTSWFISDTMVMQVTWQVNYRYRSRLVVHASLLNTCADRLSDTPSRQPPLATRGLMAEPSVLSVSGCVTGTSIYSHLHHRYHNHAWYHPFMSIPIHCHYIHHQPSPLPSPTNITTKSITINFLAPANQQWIPWSPPGHHYHHIIMSFRCERKQVFPKGDNQKPGKKLDFARCRFMQRQYLIIDRS